MAAFKSWVAADLESNQEWTFRLSEDVADEITRQSKQLAHLSEDLLSIGREQFKLSNQAIAQLRAAVDMTQRLFGISLIRGFPTRGLSESEFRVATWGVGLYMGVARPQNMAGDILTDVRDSGSANYRVVNGRGYNTKSELDFHIDSGDVVLLFCRREAKTGGQSLVANPFAIAEFLIQQDPNNERMLKHHYPFSLGGYQVDGKDYYLSPLLEDQGASSAFRINIKNIKNGAIQANVELASEYMDFLYKFQELAGASPFCYRMYLEEGDVQILNNFHTIHSRTAFEDFDDADNKRHLIRLWLCLNNSQALPESWRAPFGKITAATVRGGFHKVAVDPRYSGYAESQCRALGMSQ